jgi:large subunit ribosomal protein L17
MRHRKSGRKLKRTASHRRATLAALSTALLRHKKITTTVAKAKETRMVVEKLITRAKNAVAKTDAPAAGVHARREVGRLIRDRGVIGELFGTIAEKVAGRPGGYTRIVKLGQRQGDGAEMAVIELVDFNVGQEPAEKKQASKAKKQPRRTPSKKKPSGSTPSPALAGEAGGAGKKETAGGAGAKGTH